MKKRTSGTVSTQVVPRRIGRRTAMRDGQKQVLEKFTFRSPADDGETATEKRTRSKPQESACQRRSYRAAVHSLSLSAVPQIRAATAALPGHVLERALPGLEAGAFRPPEAQAHLAL